MTNQLIEILESEMRFGFGKYGPYHTSHEHYAVLLEEVEEWWDEIKGNTDNRPEAHYELIQIAAVALRYVLENGNLDEIKKSQDRRHRR